MATVASIIDLTADGVPGLEPAAPKRRKMEAPSSPPLVEEPPVRVEPAPKRNISKGGGDDGDDDEEGVEYEEPMFYSPDYDPDDEEQVENHRRYIKRLQDEGCGIAGCLHERRDAPACKLWTKRYPPLADPAEERRAYDNFYESEVRKCFAELEAYDRGIEKIQRLVKQGVQLSYPDACALTAHADCYDTRDNFEQAQEDADDYCDDAWKKMPRSEKRKYLVA